MDVHTSQRPAGVMARISTCIATGLGLGLVVPAPGTFGAAVWGLPLAWAIGRLPGLGWQLVAIVLANLIGIPLATAAGRALGGKKDNQAIVWDEIATVPMAFLLVPLANWKIALTGFIVLRVMDITKPPPARQLEHLPEGLGVMADDWIAGIYACLVTGGLAWLDRHFGLMLLSA